MVRVMDVQTYCIIDSQSGVCDNVTLWDGDMGVWQPPVKHIAVPQASTPSKVWVQVDNTQQWVLTETVGDGQIGYTWDGVCLTTNEAPPSPTVAEQPQPAVDGSQTL